MNFEGLHSVVKGWFMMQMHIFISTHKFSKLNIEA